MDRVKENLKKNTMLIALIIITIYFAIGTDGNMLLPRNISNLIAQNGYVVVLAVGMLMCILTGGNIDLSVGSVVCLVGAIAGKLIVTMKFNIFLSILICLVVGILIGVWQGYWIAYVRIPAFIVTLAGMLIWKGVALIVLDGLTINPFPAKYLNLFNSFVPDSFAGKYNVVSLIIGIACSLCFIAIQIIGQINKKRKGYQLDNLLILILKTIAICTIIIALTHTLAKHNGFPVLLFILGVVVLAYAYFTSKSVPGRYLYAMGGNEKAAKLSGINTNGVLFFAYVNMAFLSAVAALICVARFNSASPNAGVSYEMDAIGSCFIGGASAYGGIGTVSGVVIGAIFMGVINNGMSMMSIDSNVQKVIKGSVLLAAVIFDVLSKKRSRTA
ncbi:MAG TPA: multiple monosaccharide ABC transporter permease [Mobilitalea sp.]|nr:multiple monosaccharide ABC transporter permease [Mobilitalea sp.]